MLNDETSEIERDVCEFGSTGGVPQLLSKSSALVNGYLYISRSVRSHQPSPFCVAIELLVAYTFLTKQKKAWNDTESPRKEFDDKSLFRILIHRFTCTIIGVRYLLPHHVHVNA